MDEGEKVEGASGVSPVKGHCSNCAAATTHLNLTSKGDEIDMKETICLDLTINFVFML